MFDPLSSLKMYAIIGLLTAIVAGGIGHVVRVTYLQSQIKNKTEKIAALEAKVGTLELDVQVERSANARLASTALAQNAAIDKLNAEATLRTEASAKALAKAKATAAIYQKQYDNFLRLPPADPSNLCKSSETRIDDYLKARQGSAP